MTDKCAVCEQIAQANAQPAPQKGAGFASSLPFVIRYWENGQQKTVLVSNNEDIPVGVAFTILATHVIVVDLKHKEFDRRKQGDLLPWPDAVVT